jgi:hypothetical protein
MRKEAPKWQAMDCRRKFAGDFIVLLGGWKVHSLTRGGESLDMIAGLVIGGHVHLSNIARAVSAGNTDIHGVEKRLSGHLGSEHWDMSPVTDNLLAWSAGMADTIPVADLTDMAKPPRPARIGEGS